MTDDARAAREVRPDARPDVTPDDLREVDETLADEVTRSGDEEAPVLGDPTEPPLETDPADWADQHEPVVLDDEDRHDAPEDMEDVEDVAEGDVGDA